MIKGLFHNVLERRRDKAIAETMARLKTGFGRKCDGEIEGEILLRFGRYDPALVSTERNGPEVKVFFEKALVAVLRPPRFCARADGGMVVCFASMDMGFLDRVQVVRMSMPVAGCR